jgi:hypothetical protein
MVRDSTSPATDARPARIMRARKNRLPTAKFAALWKAVR